MLRLIPIQTLCVTIQEQQSETSGQTTAEFLEDDAYWEPADNVNELYRQLYSKKYREIVRQQVE